MVARKSGRAKGKEFEGEATYEKLQPLSRSLQEAFPDGYAPGQKLDAHGVAKLTMQLIDFMDDKMGKEAGHGCPLVRIPYKLLRDFSVDGALWVVLHACLHYKTAQGWRRMEWQNSGKQEGCLEMLRLALQELQRKGFYTRPKVFFKPTLPASQLLAMKKFLSAQGHGDIAGSETEAGVTHVLYSNPPSSEEEEPWCRTLAVRGSEAKVHWWYYPDSYDEWLPACDVQGEAEEEEGHVGPWHVHLRWLADSALYNEWMNEADYEAEEEEEVEGGGGGSAKSSMKTGRGRRGARRQQRSGGDKEEVPAEDGEGGKRKRAAEDGGTGGEDAGSKRKRSEEVDGEDAKEDGFRFRLKRQGGGFAISKAGEAGEGAGGGEDASRPSVPPEVHPHGAQKLSSDPEVVKQTIVHPPPGALSGAARLDNMSQGQQEVAVPAVAAPKQDPLMEAYRIPSHAGWFHWNQIYSLEKQALPDFFSGDSASKTPKLYKEYRAAMIQEYRKNPQRPLSFTQVRRYVVGDVNTLRRIFDFLNTWGLINFQATSAGSGGDGKVVSKWGGTPSALLETAPSGVRIVAPAVTPTAALYDFEPPRAGRVGVAGLVTRPSAAEGGGLETTRGPAVEYHCNSCQADCSERRYHCQKQADFDLCPACFGEAKFEAGLSSVDFIRMDASTESNEEWSDQETLLLLEALELFGDNWTEIGEHVGTKSKAQCILHFIRLPIEDPFLEELEDALGRRPGVAPKGTPPPPQATAGRVEATNGVTPEGGGKAVQQEEEEVELTPFADASNPVMAQMAFLAALVGPKVAAAAAQAALEALVAQDPTSQSALHSGMEVEGADGGEVAAERKGEEAAEAKTGGEAAEREGGDGVVGAVRVRAAAATALAAAAVKAKLVAEQEEREMQRLVASIVDTQVKKVGMKLQHFEELEEMLQKEKEQLERQRQQVYAERVRLAAARMGSGSTGITGAK